MEGSPGRPEEAVKLLADLGILRPPGSWPRKEAEREVVGEATEERRVEAVEGAAEAPPPPGEEEARLRRARVAWRVISGTKGYTASRQATVSSKREKGIWKGGSPGLPSRFQWVRPSMEATMHSTTASKKMGNASWEGSRGTLEMFHVR